MKSRLLSGISQNAIWDAVKYAGAGLLGTSVFTAWVRWEESLSLPRAVIFALVGTAALIFFWEKTTYLIACLKSRESVVRKWVDSSVFSSKPETPKDGEEFRLLATNPKGVALTIIGTEKKPNLISIVAKVPVSQNNMTADFRKNISLELLRQGLQFDMDTVPLHVLLQDYVLFDPVDGEHDFIRGALRVTAGVNLCRVLQPNIPPGQSQPIQDATSS